MIWEKISETFRRAVYGSRLVLITGYVQREGEVVHLIARTVVDLSHMLSEIGDRDTLRTPHQPGDELRNGGPRIDHRIVAAGRQQLQHKSRDFR